MKQKSSNKIYFQEQQRFRQWWLILIILATSIFPWIGFFYQVILGHEFGNKPSPDWIIVLTWILFGIGIPLLFLSANLITQVREDGIYLKFFPFHRKFRFYSFNEIESFEDKEYRPIREYGGWGIRYRFGKMAYNVYGNKGVQLILKNQKKILIGSQKSYEFYKAIRKLKSERFQ